VEDFITNFLAEGSYKDDKMYTFAILDRSKVASPPSGQNGTHEEGELAGMVSFVNADSNSRSVEIGLFQVLPAFRSKGIASRVGRLLLQYGMTAPEKGGLGLVRMEMRVSSMDPAAIKVARRLGFSELGKVRYDKLIKDGVARGKAGNDKPAPPGTAEGDLWQDTVIFSMTWDDWLTWEREDFY
jgi:RimJ/RimL family protein N-acetyltransferase